MMINIPDMDKLPEDRQAREMTLALRRLADAMRREDEALRAEIEKMRRALNNGGKQ